MRSLDAMTAAMVGSGGPGVAVAVTQGGAVIYQGCFGLADVEWRQPVMSDTVFALASLTKPFTALAVMLLHQDGLIDLDAPLSTYLPDYPGPGRQASVHHLLTHTSGIPNFLALPEFRERAYLHHTSEELVAIFASLPLDFESGTRYGYSNSGYRLLDMIIEKVTATPFAEVLAERVLRPAGMATACLLDDESVVPRRARGYDITGDGSVVAVRLPNMSVPGGAGGMAASLDDMVSFDHALRGHRLIAPEVEHRLYTPVELTCGRTEGYGLGWSLTRCRNSLIASHDGRIEGFSSLYARLPTHDTGIVIMSNRQDFPCAVLARGIIGEVIDLPSGPRPSTAGMPVPAGVAGVYRDNRGMARLTVEGTRIVLSHRDTTRRMVQIFADTYVDEQDPDTRLRLHRAAGKPVAVTVEYVFGWFTGYLSGGPATSSPANPPA